MTNSQLNDPQIEYIGTHLGLLKRRRQRQRRRW